MADRETLEVYDRKAGDYAARFDSDEVEPRFDAFVAKLPPGGRVLELGCGPGRTAAKFLAHGFEVDAVDASPAMAEQARALYGVEVRIATFAEVNAKGAYDGIWANFSLLHAPRAELPGHLSRLHRASRPGGPFHIGMKTGTGEKRDRLGRFYAFYGVQELTDLLEEAGFTVTHAEEGEGPGLAGDVEPWVILAAHA